MKKKMQYSQRNGKPIENPGEQLIEVPLSIANNDGNPIKGQNSYVTKALESTGKAVRYTSFLTRGLARPKLTVLTPSDGLTHETNSSQPPSHSYLGSVQELCCCFHGSVAGQWWQVSGGTVTRILQQG